LHKFALVGLKVGGNLLGRFINSPFLFSSRGIEIWRVEQFKVVSVPKNTYGSFYNGDSYIVLKVLSLNEFLAFPLSWLLTQTTQTYKVADHLAWNVHFWLGDSTSQDEAGTAAYKTVELDDFLGGRPVQYREISGHESQLFLSYFPNGLRVFDVRLLALVKPGKPDNLW